jgi:hypothetical protein
MLSLLSVLRLQAGQLSVPSLPANFRAAAAQLAFIKMDWP